MPFLKFRKMLFKDTYFDVCPRQAKTANNLTTRRINMRSEQRHFFEELDTTLAQGRMLKLKVSYYQVEGAENSYGYCNL